MDAAEEVGSDDDALDSALEAAARLDAAEDDVLSGIESELSIDSVSSIDDSIEIEAEADSQLSDSLGAFVHAQMTGGAEDLPKEYPDSEWLKVCSFDLSHTHTHQSFPHGTSRAILPNTYLPTHVTPPIFSSTHTHKPLPILTTPFLLLLFFFSRYG
tara:strand:+ start:549 stop:1019 length:471 start_codon:yes stop_codon:yes gene_type:complete